MRFARPARYKARKPGEMNKLEAAWAANLEQQKRDGKVLAFAFEAVKFRLADKTFYTPDFFVQLADGTVELHEVKGFWEDDARVKVKVFAELWPFTVRAIRRERGQWIEEVFG